MYRNYLKTLFDLVITLILIVISSPIIVFIGIFSVLNYKHLVFFAQSQPKKDIPLFAKVYPNKVFDYMAAKKPVILAIDGAIREVIEKSNGGIFVEPGNARELSQAVLEYYNNRELAAEHGENGQEYVMQNFDRKKITAEFGKFLDNMHK